MKPQAGQFFWSFICALLLYIAPLQQDRAKAESLKEALITAWQTNPMLLAERQRFFSVSTDVQSAFSAWLPQANLQLDYGINRSFSRFKQANQQGATKSETTLNPWSVNLAVTQNIFLGGQIIANVSQARFSREAAFNDLRSAEQAVLLATVTVYYNLLRDRAIVRLNRNNVSILRKRLLETRARYRVGEGTRTLVAFAEARVSAARTQLASAEASLVASQTAYQRIIGHKPAGRLAFSRPPDRIKNKEQAQQLAHKNHPTILGMRRRYDVASTAKIAAYGLFLPSVSVEGIYTQGNELGANLKGTSNFSVKGKLSMPLYRGGSSFATVRKAAHEAERARFALLDQTRQIDEFVANAWQSLRTARAQIISTSQQVKASRIALEGIRQQQLLGTSTFLDSLDAEQDYLNAQVSLATARRDQHVAAYNLLAAAGLLNAQQLNLHKNPLKQ